MFLEYSALISGIILKAFSLYFLIMCLFFMKKRSLPDAPEGASYTRFACVIAARNEEAVIGGLVRSLKAQNYPGKYIDIYVIPNNCTDNTEAEARKAGAHIIHVKGPIRSKGDALHEAFKLLLRKEDIDAFLLFDADNHVDPEYMRAMNRAFLSGAQITKSAIQASNPYESWVSGCYGLYYNIFNKFFNQSRSALGLSPKLIGTGLGISREFLLSQGGWNTITIAEDTEFNADSVMAGARIAWVPDAVTYDETPDSFRLSLTQRKRWIKGIMEVAKERTADLLSEIRCTKKDLQYFDMAMILIMPYLQILSIIPVFLMLINGLADDTLALSLLPFAAGLILSYLGTAAFALLLAILSPYEVRPMIKSILMFPVFTLSWMPLCWAAMLDKNVKWVQIRHKGTAFPAAALGRS